MQIQAFWAKGYRSLLDVNLSNLGQFNVFYGQNGAGKSNILAAMDVLVRAAALRIPDFDAIENPKALPAGPFLINDDDFCHAAPTPTINLGMTVSNADAQPLFRSGGYSARQITFEITFERVAARGIAYRVTQLSDRPPDNHQSLLRTLRSIDEGNEPLRNLRLAVARWFESVGDAYRVVPAVRSIRAERGDLGGQIGLTELLSLGRIKEAFVLALTNPDPIIRGRFTRLRELLAGEPLYSAPFDPVYDPQTQRYEIRGRSGVAGARDVPLDLAGLGVQQIYAVLGQIVLGRTAAVGIEEPEAHLHAPTSGRHLRVLLRRLVEQGDVQQLFISTHSNLFDLDPSGYYDVRNHEGVTVVERKPLREIDSRHLYEPGPAKHGLEDLLRLLEEDVTVLRRPDGSPVSAVQMLELLQEDAPEALDFLRDVHGAAVRAVQLRAARKK